MSNELICSYNSSTATIYSILRKQSDNSVYSTVTGSFEVWSNANLANYAITMAHRGGDVYTGDMPSVASNNYTCIYYLQAGASPALTDSILVTEQFYWTSPGATPTPSGSVQLSAYALVTLEETKRQLGYSLTDATYDDAIKQQINQYSSFIESQTGRNFVSRDYVEFGRSRSDQYVCKNYPITEVNKLSWIDDIAFTISYTGTDIMKSIGVSSTGISLKSQTVSGTYSTDHYLFATYPTSNLLALALSGVAGITVNIYDNYPAKYIIPLAAKNIVDKTIDIHALYDDSAYSAINESAGIIGLVNSQKNSYLMVDYTAGYTAVPEDIKNATIELIRDNLAIPSGAGSNLKSVSLDTYSYSVGDIVVSERVQATINKYMSVGISRFQD